MISIQLGRRAPTCVPGLVQPLYPRSLGDPLVFLSKQSDDRLAESHRVVVNGDGSGVVHVDPLRTDRRGHDRNTELQRFDRLDLHTAPEPKGNNCAPGGLVESAQVWDVSLEDDPVSDQSGEAVRRTPTGDPQLRPGDPRLDQREHLREEPGQPVDIRRSGPRHPAGHQHHVAPFIEGPIGPSDASEKWDLGDDVGVTRHLPRDGRFVVGEAYDEIRPGQDPHLERLHLVGGGDAPGPVERIAEKFELLPQASVEESLGVVDQWGIRQP